VRNDVRLESLTYDSSIHPATFAQHFLDKILNKHWRIFEAANIQFDMPAKVVQFCDFFFGLFFVNQRDYHGENLCVSFAPWIHTSMA